MAGGLSHQFRERLGACGDRQGEGGRGVNRARRSSRLHGVDLYFMVVLQSLQQTVSHDARKAT